MIHAGAVCVARPVPERRKFAWITDQSERMAQCSRRGAPARWQRLRLLNVIIICFATPGGHFHTNVPNDSPAHGTHSMTVRSIHCASTACSTQVRRACSMSRSNALLSRRAQQRCCSLVQQRGFRSEVFVQGCMLRKGK